MEEGAKAKRFATDTRVSSWLTLFDLFEDRHCLVPPNKNVVSIKVPCNCWSRGFAIPNSLNFTRPLIAPSHKNMKMPPQF
jgi:hypothetical protein